MRPRNRQAATLIEVLIAVSIGAVVVGSAMYLYLAGNNQFTKTTEHAQMREEVLLVMEQLAKDLDQLMVSDEVIPGAPGQFYLTRPFELLDPRPQTYIDPADGKQKVNPNMFSSMKFFQYHHTDTVKVNNKGQIDPSGVDRPRLVGQQVHYESKMVDPGDPKKGMNLFRNGEKINSMALSVIIFRAVPPNVAAENIGASPNAVLEVTIVPRTGMWGAMSDDTLFNLRKDGQVFTRIFHLISYESQYTATLDDALAKLRRAAQRLASKGDTRFYNPTTKVYNLAQ